MISPVSGIFEELKWRGLIAQTTDESALRAALNGGPIVYYGGFDPTAQSLHIGHLVLVLTMRRLQLAGHHPIALVGGATGLIGDPRPTTERSMQSQDVVAGWADRIKAQLSGILRFDGANPARMVNNLDWIGSITAIELLRDAGKHFRMSTMLGRDIVARRLASDEGLSFTEFSYQILQALDFRELNRTYDCVLQMGGNDQWGNMVGGAEFIRKSWNPSVEESATGSRLETTGSNVSNPTKQPPAVHVLATPLITKSDGTKMGKSEGGAVWLDPELMSPYAFYQFWLNTADDDVVHYLKVFTFRTATEIEQLADEFKANPGARAAQRALASDVTTIVHGEQATVGAIAASEALFGRGELADLDAATWSGIAREVKTALVPAGTLIVDAAVATGIVKSKGEARRAISEGGLYLNNAKVPDADQELFTADFLEGEFALLRRGKKTLAVAKLDTPL
jgi:tyrosyl-tRNA synthetase